MFLIGGKKLIFTPKDFGVKSLDSSGLTRTEFPQTKLMFPVGEQSRLFGNALLSRLWATLCPGLSPTLGSARRFIIRMTQEPFLNGATVSKALESVENVQSLLTEDKKVNLNKCWIKRETSFPDQVVFITMLR